METEAREARLTFGLSQGGAANRPQQAHDRLRKVEADNFDKPV
jgi:hypothetical protein